MRAIYSNPNNYINGKALPIPEKFQGKKYARVGVTDMELTNLVRNKEWFDMVEFFIIENQAFKSLSKQEVSKEFGIQYIGNTLKK